MLTIYKASAGSGKTFTLTLEYIKLLIGTKNPETGTYTLNERREKPHKSILAVTFTNKATEEMKKRIVKELSLLASNPDKSPYIDELKTHFQCNESEKISKAASNSLYSLLFAFSYFNVSTIDSFFQQVLRTFAFEIDRNGSFEIELDRSGILSEALSRLFSKLDNENSMDDHLRNKRLKHWLEKYMDDRIANGLSFNVFNRQENLFNILVAEINHLMDETFSLNSPRIMPYLEDPRLLDSFEKALVSRIAIIDNSIAKDAEEYLDALIQADMVLFSKIPQNWLNDRIKKKPGEKLNKTMTDCLTDPRKLFKKTTTARTRKLKAPEPPMALLELGQRLVEKYDSAFGTLTQLRVVRQYLFHLGIIGLVMSEIKELCRENNTILISDTNDLLHQIIGKENSPFIYERMGVRLHNFLIDEFQDTSRMQWGNITPLINESLSRDNDNLIIGDEKQSIYRFRNAAPELLGHEVAEQISHSFNSIRERGLKLVENRNWRSAKEIIQFNNTLFFSLGTKDLFPAGNAYSNVIQDIPKQHSDFHGCVEFNFIDADTNQKFIAEATEQTVRRVGELLKKYSPSDIAILIRRNSEAPLIINALLRAMEPSDDGCPPRLPHFEIISNEALRVVSSPAIKLVVNILRLANLPEKKEEEPSTEDDTPKEKKRWKNRRETVRLHHRFELLVTEEFQPGQALVDAMDNQGDSGYTLKNPTEGKTTDLNSIVENIISSLPDRLIKNNTVFLTAFQDIVRDYSKRNPSDLHSFLKYWDTNADSFTLTSPESSDSMVITTVHKSKGIEYKCVVIPYFGLQSRVRNEVSWTETGKIEGVPDEIIPPIVPVTQSEKLSFTPYGAGFNELKKRQNLDDLNVAYVAFTRAVEQLIVISRRGKDKIAIAIEESINEMTPETVSELRQNMTDPRAAEAIVSLSDKFDSSTSALKFGEARDCEIPKIKKNETVEIMPDYAVYDNSDLLRFVKLETDEDFDPDSARVKGEFLHTVLSSVNSPDDLDYACRKQGELAELPENLLEERRMLLRKAIDSPKAHRWFYGYKRVITERPIAITGTMTERPDRIVWTADGYIDVVDYKFGTIHAEKYHRQVARYVGFLRESGLKNVRGFLWYPLTGEVVTVDPGTPSLFD